MNAIHTLDDLLTGIIEFIDWADGLFVVAIILIGADLFFGTKAAKKRGEVVRRSRAIRRTMDKVCSYILWLMIAFPFGQAFGTPFGIDLLPLMVILIVYVIELESIFINYFAWRGIKAKVNIWKLFSKKTDIIELENDEQNDNNNNEK